MPQNHDRIAGVVIFSVCALLFYNTLDFPPESATFPRIVLVLALILSGWMVLRSFILVQWRDMEFEDFFIHGGRFCLAVTVMGLYIYLINILGYYSTTILYIPAMALLLGYRNKIVIAIATLSYLTIILVVFDILFERQLPKEFFMQ